MALDNRFIAIGNLVADPESDTTQGGTTKCKFRLGMNQGFGERKHSVFADFLAFGKKAEFIAKYLKKGDKVHVDADYDVDSWEDKGTGEKRSRPKFVVNDVAGLNPKPKSAVPAAEAAPATATGEANPIFGEADEDIPF